MKFKLEIINKKGIKSFETNKEDLDYLSFLRDHGYSIPADCGGRGICGKCLIRFIYPENPELTPVEKELLPEKLINSGYRLACQQQIHKSSRIALEFEESIKSVGESFDVEFTCNPMYSKYLIQAKQIVEDGKTGIIDNLLELTGLKKVELSALKKFGKLINKSSQLTLTIQNKTVNDITEGNTVNRLFGLAVDAGTTTVAVYLVDLNTGNTLDYLSQSNLQRTYGADIISRIQFTRETKKGNDIIQKKLLETINQAQKILCQKNNISEQDIYNCTVCGNPFVLHSLLAVSVDSLGEIPYSPIFNSGQIIRAKETSLNINNRGTLSLIPGLAGNVGSDLTAGLLVIEKLQQREKPYILLDIGTNGEIVLNTGNEVLCCAAAAGPALEGGNISCGTAGIPGAISGVQKGENGPNLETIGSRAPIGICGSGVIDLTAYLLEKKIIDSTGKISKAIDEKQIIEHESGKAFLISQDNNIYLSQKDIREIQLAKGAIATGIEILLEEADLNYEAINNIFLAGGFGSSLKTESICRLGILPDKVKNKIMKLGNSAGTGTRLYLLDDSARKRAEKLRKKAVYFSLGNRMDFQKKFVQNMNFPEHSSL